MSLGFVVLVAVGALVFFVGYRLVDRAWRRWVLMRVARRLLPVAPMSLRTPTQLEPRIAVVGDGWLFDGPLGAAPGGRRPPARTRGVRVTITDSDQAEPYDSGHE